MRVLVRWTVVAVALLTLSGCLVGERQISGSHIVGSHWASVPLYDEHTRVIVPTERAEIAKHDLSVLALSGGGADGAFGAGLLVGWTESGKRPAFDIVTGVSTGALMATFAFLGPAYDAQLEKFYTTTTNGDIFTDRGLAGLMSDSMYDTQPLVQRIADVVDEKVLAEVAAEHRKGRRLFMATTNLDSGMVTVWNMGELAASGQPDSLELYRDIILASAAVPGFFKPVMIPLDDTPAHHGQMHVDGGVKAPVLVRSFMLAGPYKHKNLYIVVNGALRLRSADEPVKPSLAGIARKSIGELLRGLTYKTLYQTYVMASRAHTNFNLAYVPDDVKESENPLHFDPAEMQRLFEVGRKLGRDGAWRHEPPRLEPLERVAPEKPAAARRPVYHAPVKQS